MMMAVRLSVKDSEIALMGLPSLFQALAWGGN